MNALNDEPYQLYFLNETFNYNDCNDTDTFEISNDTLCETEDYGSDFWNDTDTFSKNTYQNSKNILNDINLSHIEKYLREKKLENINKK